MKMDSETCGTSSLAGPVTEYKLDWPGAPAMAIPMTGEPKRNHDPFSCCLPGGGSTHELVYDRKGGKTFWVSGQNYDHVASIELDGKASFYAMPPGSRPHGMAVDKKGRVWVSFEGSGELALLNPDGTVARTIDVAIYADQIAGRFNPRPHGLRVAEDGALWFTGKLSNTVGRVRTDGTELQHFALSAIGAVPIYLSASPDGAMWCTELGASSIARIGPDGKVREWPTPTENSRPIAIVCGPDGKSMWFTEEAGGMIGRIDLDAPEEIIEYPVPLTHRDAILAGLAFDADGNLWVQQYIKPPANGPTGDDYIVRFDKTLIDALAGDLSNVTITYFKAPSQRSVMHRITAGPDGNIWFSELGLNQIGKIDVRKI